MPTTDKGEMPTPETDKVAAALHDLATNGRFNANFHERIDELLEPTRSLETQRDEARREAWKEKQIAFRLEVAANIYKEDLATLRRQSAALQEALKPLADLADAYDADLIARGARIPEVHEGDDSAVAWPEPFLIPYLRPRPPHGNYLSMRDACAARKAIRNSNPTSP